MHRHRAFLACVLLLGALLLAGCAATSVVTQAPRLQLPSTLKSLPPMPPVIPDTASETEFWDWVVALWYDDLALRSTHAAVLKAIGQ